MTNQAQERDPTHPPIRTASERIRTVTGDSFKRLVLEDGGPVVVEFMSYGCAHCRILEPTLQKVAELVKDKKMFRVNVAIEQELAEQYAIRGTPTLIMFMNGTEVGRADGPSPTVAAVLSAVTRPFE
jgi:thioredoxin-like negative regulator of GroEL